jgi:uridine kinase
LHNFDSTLICRSIWKPLDDVRFHRKKVRDITERQRSLEFIQAQYENTVLPAVRQYVLPSKPYADLVLDSKWDIATVEKSLYDAIVIKHLTSQPHQCVRS